MKKNSFLFPFLRVGCLLGAVTLISLASSQGAVISSTPFSIGYGANVEGNTWTQNTPTTLPTPGAFALTQTLAGTFGSWRGPTFPSRVLTNSNVNLTNFSARSDDFQASLTATWNGDPAITFPGVDPANLVIRLTLTQIRIYGIYFGAETGSILLSFQETTPGHLQTSDTISLNKYSGDQTPLTVAGNYRQLIWNPDDQWVSGTSATRTFSLSTNVGAALVDGFEVFGYIEVTTVPEPSALLLSSGAAGLLLFMARRRRTLLKEEGKS